MVSTPSNQTVMNIHFESVQSEDTSSFQTSSEDQQLQIKPKKRYVVQKPKGRRTVVREIENNVVLITADDNEEDANFEANFIDIPQNI